MDEELLPAVVRRALWWCVGGAVLFTAFAAATTQVRALRAHSPWQDDPYDVVVSFTQLLVPALAVAMAIRIAGRRPQPRLRDLLRGGRALVAMVAVTVVTDWVAVARGEHGDDWGGTGQLLIAALAVVTLAAAAAAVALRRATARTGDNVRVAPQPAGPDWTDDVLAGVGDLVGRCGAAGRVSAEAVGWLRRVVVGGRHGLRRHHLASVVLACVAVSAGLAVGEASGDGLGPHPAAAAAARIVIGAAGLLTVLLPLDAYLGLLRPGQPLPSTPGLAGRRPALVCAAYAVVASVSVTVGFRDGIGDMVDYPVTGWGPLAAVVAVVAVLAGLVTLLAQATRRRRRRLAKALLAVPLVVVLAAVGTVAYLGVRHLQPRELPAPTGPYGVGRAAYDWTDTARTDPLAPEPGRHRELSVWIWYPAPAGTSGPPAPYAPGDWAGILRFGILASRLDAVTTHSVVAAPVAAGRFPLVVLEPGMGLSAPHLSTLAEDLASHGYVVAGVTPTYSANVTVLDGHPVASTAAGNPQDSSRVNGDRLVAVWAADARFVADQAIGVGDQLAGHVDASRVAYVGHSFGGAASLQACHDDRRCAGAVDMDGTPYVTVVTAGLAAPMMLLGTPGDCLAGACHPTDADQRDIDAASRSLRATSTGPGFRYEIAGAEHFNFTDYGAYYIPAPLRGLVQLGPIDGDRGLVVVSASVTAFLDHVLHGGPAPRPDDQYPEVHPAA